MGGGTGTGDIQRFRDDLLDGGIRGNFYRSPSDPLTVYTPEDLEKGLDDPSKGLQLMVKITLYTSDGVYKERTRIVLEDSMNDERLYGFTLSINKKDGKKRTKRSK